MSDRFDFEHAGRCFRCVADYDETHGMPWDEYDGHGTIRTASTYAGRTDKKPGEIVLHVDGRTAWIYDFQGAVATARAENWGSANCTPEMTPGQRAAQAARADMDYCRTWLTGDRWFSVLEVFEIDDDGEKVGESEYLGGVESGYDKQTETYTRECAAEMADEIVARIEANTYAGATVGYV